jgi:hypothetical protein
MALPRFRPVTGLAGFASLASALFLLIRSLYVRNAYEIVLSSALLIFWLAFFLTGLWRARRFSLLEPGWKPPAPLVAEAGAETLITGLAVAAPVFFRLHFVLGGRFFPQGGERGCPFFAETSVDRRAGTARLTLRFPMGGVFQGEGRCFLRDIFGFFSFPCGIPLRRTLRVRSAPPMDVNFRLKTLSGAEDRRNKTSSDEERYYMREYAPGDRFRDINWKSSERIDTLITRISPDNQEKVSRVEVRFRNYGPAGNGPAGTVKDPPLLDLWLLDRAKARLSWFLRRVMEEGASYIFHVTAAQGSWEISDQDELEAFLEELAGLPFAPTRNGDPAEAAALPGEIYVFSTACDSGLGSFLLTCQKQELSLFLAESPPESRRREKPDPEDAPALCRLRGFPAWGLLPALRWFKAGKARRLPVSGFTLKIDTAEVRW